VLFADLSGYTTMAATLDPEEVHDVVAPVLDRLVAIALRAGGVVPQIQGDGFMAVFGIPRANEDDAARAVRAGLDIVAATADDENLPDIHAGVESGEVLVQDHWEASGFRLIGDAVVLASRLCSMAEPGTLLAGPRVHELTRREVSFGPPDRPTVRGMPAAVDVRMVLGDAPSSAMQAGRGPVVDRSEPRAALRAAWDEVVGGGVQRVATLTGEVGLGKTRLAADLIERIAADPAPGLVVTVRCGVRPPGTPFLPLVRGLLEAVVPKREEPGREVGEVSDVVELLADRAGLTDAHARRGLLGLVGREGLRNPARYPVPDDEADIGDVLLKVVAGLARGAPVLVVVDDVDRADADLTELLGRLRPAAGSPVLWLLIGRPGAGVTSDVHLVPLSREDSRLLLREELPPGATAEVVEGLARRSAGVPLLLVECARAARDGAIGRGVVGNPTMLDLDATVPLTVHGVLAAQIDRLPDDERAAVEAISVTGGVIRPDAFRGMFPEGEAALGRLVRRGLVRTVRVAGRRVDAAASEVAAYELVPPLLGQVAYASLPRAARVPRHLAAASWLRSRADDPFELGDTAAELVYHEERVWRHRRFAPPAVGAAECEQAGVRAAAALAVLARRLLELSPRAAGERAMRGLEIVADGAPVGDGVRAELELRRAQALREAWEFDEALAAASRADGWAVRAGDDRLRADAGLTRGDCLSWLGRVEEARAVLDEAGRRLAELDEPVRRARATQLRAYTWRYCDLGRLAAELEEAYGAFVVAGESGAAALIAAELAYIATESSQADVDRWAAAAAALADSGDYRLGALLARARGYGAYLRGRWSEAASPLEEARMLAEQAGLVGVAVEAARVRAACLAALGRYAEARTLLAAATARDDHASWRRQVSLALLVEATIALSGGNVAGARARLAEARRVLEEISSLQDLTDVVTVRAVIACHVGGPEGDRFDEDVASAIIDLEAGGVPLLVIPLLAATTRLRLLTDPAGARDALRAVVERARQAGADGHLVAARLCAYQADLLTNPSAPAPLAPSAPAAPAASVPAADQAASPPASASGLPMVAEGDPPESRALAAECAALRAVLDGDPDRAREALRRAVVGWADHGDSVWHARALLWSAELSGSAAARLAAERILVRIGSPLRPDELLLPLRAMLSREASGGLEGVPHTRQEQG
jgi:class 3 adenylate cyclase